jgi:hypothetical protein
MARRRLWRLVLALAAAVFARGNRAFAADLAHAHIVVEGSATSWRAY